MHSHRLLSCFVIACAFLSSAAAAIVGTNVPAQPLTLERVNALPESEQPAWKEYLKNSQQQRQADQEFLRKEMREHKIKQLIIPPESSSKKWIPLEEASTWYAGVEARHTADCLLSFQTPAGGWSKNMDMSGNLRLPGMHFGTENNPRHPDESDFDVQLDRSWNYIGTFDNDATITQLRFLARVISATATNENSRYRSAFVKGIHYITAAQYPNGGWPQVWPLSGGYHDAITFNDNALLNVMTFVREVSKGTSEFSFVSEDLRAASERYFQRALKCLLRSQVVVDGRRTSWPQQCDMLTLQPCSARNYEMPSVASSESANIVLFLMQLPNPDWETASAVHGAAAWFEKTQIRDKAFKSNGSDGRLLISAPGNGPIWSRYYEIGSDRPIFGDRDKTIHDDVSEISKERRNGYAWFTDGGRRVLQHYARWSKEHPKR